MRNTTNSAPPGTPLTRDLLLATGLPPCFDANACTHLQAATCMQHLRPHADVVLKSRGNNRNCFRNIQSMVTMKKTTRARCGSASEVWVSKRGVGQQARCGSASEVWVSKRGVGLQVRCGSASQVWVSKRGVGQQARCEPASSPGWVSFLEALGSATTDWRGERETLPVDGTPPPSSPSPSTEASRSATCAE